MSGYLVTFIFHRLGEPRVNDIYTQPEEILKRLINEATAHRLPLVGWDELDREAPSELIRNKVAITFDDGCDSDVTKALPILLEADVQATFFVVTGSVGRPGRLSWSEVRALADAGMTVGSHTASHPRLIELPTEKLIEELARSKHVLEDKLGRIVTSLAIPGGYYDRRVLDTCHEAGYRIVGVSDNGIDELPIASSGRPAVLHRNCIDARMPWDSVVQLLRGKTPRPLLLKSRARRFVHLTLGASVYEWMAKSLRR